MGLDWSVLLSTFGFVFVAELGDKTQLAVISQTCKYRRPWPVFLGSAAALISTTALGAVGGRALSALIPADVIRFIAAAAFVVMGLLVWREAQRKESDVVCATDEAACEDPQRRWDWRAFSATFTLLFVAELGDKTQLAVMGLATKQAPWAVFAGGALALTAVTALGVLGGQQLTRLIPEKLLLRLSAAAFVILGILMGLGVL